MKAIEKRQFRVLYREALLRIVDLELLSSHAKGDSGTLLGQFASLLIFCSLVLSVAAAIWANIASGDRMPALTRMVGMWTIEHFLIATTMLVVGLFAVLSWDSTFPDRRDVMVIGPLPVRARTLFLAKVAAVGSFLGLTLAALHVAAGLAWPIVLADSRTAPVPALIFDAPLPPVGAEDFPGVMNRDIEPMLQRLDLLAADGGAGVVIGISSRGQRRVIAYGAAKPDSLFEIGSISKTFTGLLMAQMAAEGKLDLRDRVRDLLPNGTAAPARGFEIALLDLATHHSGLPMMPDNAGAGTERQMYTEYHAPALYDYVRRHGLDKPAHPKFEYSNFGFAMLGVALENRAGASYPEMLRREIAGPLGLTDTAVALSAEQRGRFLQGYGAAARPALAWDMDAFAGAGGVRSSAGDMLTYLEAQLHPERTPLPAALVESQRARAYITGQEQIALAWNYNPSTGVYAHDGATGGFTSYACFNPKKDFAAVVLVNSHSLTFPVIRFLGEHVRQRLSGEAAIALGAVSVPPAGLVRSFLAYWITMLAAGVFMFCCVLGVQGVAAQVLPRRWFLRISAFLQFAVFCLLVSGYFLQRSPATVLLDGARQPWISWIPSYWFAGVYQQVSGSLHPGLVPFARRAWMGLAIAVAVTASSYAASYFRTLRRIVDEPDIGSSVSGGWLPRAGRSFETAVVHFSIRGLLRSRRHRMILSFYLGAALGFAILALNLPSEVSGGPWAALSIPLLASTIMLMGFWVVGARVAFAQPLDLRANWIFRTAPLEAGRRCLDARRRALLMVSVVPAWTICGVLLFALWPWQAAAAHLGVLALLGVILAEASFDGVQRIPFTCSYLPGQSNFHFTFWLWMLLLASLITGTAASERAALQSPVGTVLVLAGLAMAAVACVAHNRWSAAPNVAELRFEEEPSDKLVGLNLSS